MSQRGTLANSVNGNSRSAAHATRSSGPASRRVGGATKRPVRVASLADGPANWEKLDTCIGRALQIMRAEHGFSQNSLALALRERTGRNVTASYVSKIERGRSSVSWQRLALLCGILGCRPSEVVRKAENLLEHILKPQHELVQGVMDEVKKRLAQRDISPAQREVLLAMQADMTERLAALV